MPNVPTFRLRPTALALASAVALLTGCGGGADPHAVTTDAARETPMAVAGTAAVDQARDFIVVFKPSVGSVNSLANSLASAHRGQVRFTYNVALRGFAVRLPAGAADAFLEAMGRNPQVDHVEADVAMSNRSVTQTNATWGLDRTDQLDLPLNGSYSHSQLGTGVRAYVVDTGLNAAHVEFGDRLEAGYSAINDGNGTTDCNGHGTHVSGTIAGATYGMAKGATLVPVRVLDCAGSGTSAGVIAGLDWVAANAPRPAVVNMSLGGGASSTLDAAVANVVAKGIAVVVAAGNSNVDACTASPAREPSAITVGATTSGDARASYSNFGACLDVYAPGSGITSAWYTSSTALASLNGTSMASPHVAGLAALMLQANPDATPAQLAGALRATASSGRIADAGTGSPNLLINTAAVGSVAPPPPVTATAVAVGALSGTGALVRNGWRATTTVKVVNSNGVAVGGAAVTGNYTVGGTGLKCTTASTGVCTLSSGNLSAKTLQTQLTVTGISGTGLSYNATANVLSSVVVKKP